MANANVTIRVDESLKHEADSLFDEMGMSFTTAINVFVKQAVREGRIPFEITTTPNANNGRLRREYAVVDVTSLAELAEK